MRGARSIVCSWRSIYRPRHPMGDCPIARSASVSRQGREAHSSAATTFGRASPSAVAEQANSAMEPTALRAAAQRPASFDAMGGLTGDGRPRDSMRSRTLFTAMLLLATVAGGVVVDAQTAKMPTVAY